MADRNNNNTRPLKPTLASNRGTRTPLTPRIAPNATLSSKSTVSKPSDTVRSAPPRITPRIKQEETPVKEPVGNGSVTPRSSARKSRIDSNHTTPTQPEEATSIPRPRTTIAATNATGDQNGTVGGLGIAGARAARPKSVISGGVSVRPSSPPLLRSPGHLNLGPGRDDSIESRFFHASDVAKTEPPPKKPEPKKAPTFFYADGGQEERKSVSPRASSPVLSAVSEKRSSAPWIRGDGASNPSKSPPMLSPALSSLTNTSPFFAAATGQPQPKPRSPSPGKESIHLSYRKGASQIFGTRTPTRTTDVGPDIGTIFEERRGSVANTVTPHRKSPSLSSIDSGNSHQSRRRSATGVDNGPTPSPLVNEVKAATVPRLIKPVPSIDTTLDPPETPAVHEDTVLSPTKSVSELAADARRERKVLDLEISNSSLLAINSSLEREVRRQKAELKRFRRLSRAGRFSFNPNERSGRISEGLSTLGEDIAEDGADAEYAAFGPPSGFTDIYDDFSEDDEDESVTSGGEPMSPRSQSSRLARDEKRLQVDLEKHKELLVQSQMMNQSLKRCMYATEEMIKDGKKALLYSVRVSDVKLGGRILTGHEDEDERVEEIEVEDETLHGDDAAQDFLKVWQSVGRPPPTLDGSEGGDRDSGIEVDRAPQHARPPDVVFGAPSVD